MKNIMYTILISLVLITMLLASILFQPAWAAGNGAYDLIVFGSYSNFYYRLVRISDVATWTSSGLDTTPTWDATSCYSVTYSADVGGYAIDFDATIKDGVYAMPIYDAATPANTDVPVAVRQVNIRSGTLQSMEIYNE